MRENYQYRTPEHLRAAEKVKNRARIETLLQTLTCTGCKQPFKQRTLMQKLFCSTACRHRHHKTDSTTHRKRARYFNVPYEYITWRQVFVRDLWLCGICGEPTPERLRGTTDDLAPELDHVIPMSRGGGHTYSNVRCAHRVCNLRKANLLDTELTTQTNCISIGAIDYPHGYIALPNHMDMQ
jgi:hypothetical protein